MRWEDWNELAFGLLYVQHGGSGLFLGGMPGLLELDFEQLEFFVERLDEQRAAEAQALRNAGKK